MTDYAHHHKRSVVKISTNKRSRRRTRIDPSPIQTVTVGPGLAPGPPLDSRRHLAGHGLNVRQLTRVSPPVGNCTLPRRIL